MWLPGTIQSDVWTLERTQWAPVTLSRPTYLQWARKCYRGDPGEDRACQESGSDSCLLATVLCQYYSLGQIWIPQEPACLLASSRSPAASFPQLCFLQHTSLSWTVPHCVPFSLAVLISPVRNKTTPTVFEPNMKQSLIKCWPGGWTLTQVPQKMAMNHLAEA